VVTTLNGTHLNFDIESNELTNSVDYNLTAQALAQAVVGNANGTPTPTPTPSPTGGSCAATLEQRDRLQLWQPGLLRPG